jgi:SAM-dependent methyltransferase
MSDPTVVRLAAIIQELARRHAAAAPPPRPLPYLGLEHPSGTGFHLLDALSARGIFRKYELVLDLGAGLGATSRWLAGRLGCEVVGTTVSEDEAAAGTELSRRARRAVQVHLVPAATDALPFRTGRFTHVWAIEALARVTDPAATLRDALRVLRPGGTIAIQELVRTGDDAGVRGWRFLTADALLALLRSLAVADLDARDRTAEHPERSAQVTAGRTSLLERLRVDAALVPYAAERSALGDALAGGRLGVLQVLGRRI